MTTVEELRAQSHTTLTNLVAVLGYPPHWVDELERRAFAAGRIWSPELSRPESGDRAARD